MPDAASDLAVPALSDLIGNADAFPVLRHYDFFNHAGVCPIPAVTADRIRRFADEASTTAYIGCEWFKDIERLRTLCAKFINAGRDEIALVKNTSEGIAIVASGIDWKAGDVVVTTAVEYPANIYPWMQAAKLHGVELVMVPEQTMPDGSRQVPIDDILKAADRPKVRLVTLSHVEFASGQRHDLARIGRFCRDNGKLFCVDAIQSVGVCPVDVRAMHIDYLAADGHKWMLGPEGAGFFYCRRELLEETRPLAIGWLNVVNDQAYGDYDFTLKPDARRYECGSYNVPGFLGLYGALQLLDGVGVGVVHDRIQVLLDRLAAGLKDKGYGLISSRDPAIRAGILSFESKNVPHGAVIKTLREHNIEIALREGRLRASPHFYNTEAQIDRLLEALPTG